MWHSAVNVRKDVLDIEVFMQQPLIQLLGMSERTLNPVPLD